MMLLRVLVWTLFFLATSVHAYALEPDEVFARVSDGIVSVVAATDSPHGISRGSGIVVGSGEIVTACSVVQNATFIAVARAKFKTVAKLRFVDPDRDLCQLEVGESKGFRGALRVNAATSRLRVGQKVYVIGAPDGIELTLTDGIVSSIRASEARGEILMTARTWPESSGGGLFDSRGNLVGVVIVDRNRDEDLSVAIAANWIIDLPNRATDLIKEESLRIEREQRCFEQFERSLLDRLWDEESDQVFDPDCAGVRINDERRRAAIELERRLRGKEQRKAGTAPRTAEMVLVQDFKARISAKVRQRVVIPRGMIGNPEAVYEVTLVPGGDVLLATLKKASGAPAYDLAVARAIDAASPLPVPDDPKLFQRYFRKFNMSFRPKE